MFNGIFRRKVKHTPFTSEQLESARLADVLGSYAVTGNKKKAGKHAV
jgi:hypothetical protein